MDKAYDTQAVGSGSILARPIKMLLKYSEMCNNEILFFKLWMKGLHKKTKKK